MKHPLPIVFNVDCFSNVICFNDEQFLNAYLLIEVTDDRIIICSSDVQPSNAYL